MNPDVMFIENWHDPRVSDIYDQSHCMEYLSEGVWFHHRLNTVIVVNNELKHSVKYS